MKFAILDSHAIQYHVPVFRQLARVAPGKFHTFFCSRTGYANTLDKGFGHSFKWDIPLLDGYESTFLPAEDNDPGPGLHYFSHFWREFEDRKCDGLFIWNTYASAAFPRYIWEARRREVPVVFRADTYRNPEQSGLKLVAKNAYLRAAFRFIDQFAAVGTWSREFYGDLGIPAARITDAPYAIDNEFFANSSLAFQSQRDEIRKELGCGSEVVVFSQTGKYHEPKRPLDLVRAAAMCSDLPVHFVFIGEGELRGALEAEIARLKLKNVTLTGFVNQSQLPRYYVASDVSVVCSTHNPWITVVNEAMCCGLPLLLSNAIGAAADLLHEGENGHSFAMGDLESLAAGIRRFVEYGPDLRRRMGVKSQAMIAHWGIPELAGGFVQACTLAANRGQAPTGQVPLAPPIEPKTQPDAE